MTEDEILKIRESELEKIIEEKVEKRLSKRKNKEKTRQTNISRREFLKKAGIGAFGLAALSSPVSAALNIRDTGLNAYTQNTGETLTFDVDNNGNVSIPEGNLSIKENTALHAGNLSNFDATQFSGSNGTNGQILQTDGNNTTWTTIDTNAPVDSVNSQTGTVTLNANDIGAKPDSYTAPVDSVNGQTGDVTVDNPNSTQQEQVDSGQSSDAVFHEIGGEYSGPYLIYCYCSSMTVQNTDDQYGYSTNFIVNYFDGTTDSTSVGKSSTSSVSLNPNKLATVATLSDSRAGVNIIDANVRHVRSHSHDI